MDIWHDDEGVWTEVIGEDGVKELRGPFQTEEEAENEHR